MTNAQKAEAANGATTQQRTKRADRRNAPGPSASQPPSSEGLIEGRSPAGSVARSGCSRSYKTGSSDPSPRRSRAATHARLRTTPASVVGYSNRHSKEVGKPKDAGGSVPRKTRSVRRADRVKQNHTPLQPISINTVKASPAARLIGRPLKIIGLVPTASRIITATIPIQPKPKKAWTGSSIHPSNPVPDWGCPSSWPGELERFANSCAANLRERMLLLIAPMA